MDDASKSATSPSPDPPSAGFSSVRRELLKRAAWAVPIIAALPLSPMTARATNGGGGHGFGSPTGGGGSSGGGSGGSGGGGGSSGGGSSGGGSSGGHVHYPGCRHDLGGGMNDAKDQAIRDAIEKALKDAAADKAAEEAKMKAAKDALAKALKAKAAAKKANG